MLRGSHVLKMVVVLKDTKYGWQTTDLEGNHNLVLSKVYTS